MGMTTGQFRAYIMLILDELNETINETDEKKKAEKLEKLCLNLRISLED